MVDAERYISVEMSLIGSLLEIREMQAGRLPKKTWKELRAEIEKEIEKEDSQMETTRDYISVEQSIIDSLIEVKLMQEGKLSKPTLEDFFAHLDEMVEQEKANENNPDEKIQ